MTGKEIADSAKVKKIREYILKSGYPLEIEIGNILRKTAWIVGNQWPYTDSKEKKIRAIDILAMRLMHRQLGLMMVIECKKSEKHDWVFYTQQKERELLPLLGTFVDFLKKIAKPPISEKLTQLYATSTLGELFGAKTSSSALLSKLSGLHLLNPEIRMGIFNVIPTKEGENQPRGKKSTERDDFFEATQQLISALESIGGGMKNFIVFPVIVFDGELYEFYQSENEMEFMPINHVQFISFGTEMSPCMIDIVRKTYFHQFLKIMENDFAILSEIINYEGEGRQKGLSH